MGETVDRRLAHAHRDGRLARDALGEGHRRGERLAVVHDVLDQPPVQCVGRADPVRGEDHRLFGAGRPHQRQHARDRAPAHVHAEFDLGNAEMRRAAAGAEVERHDQRRAAADAMAFDGGDGHLLHVLPGLAHLRSQPLTMNALADRQPSRARPSGSLRSKPAEKALAEPVRITTEVSRSSLEFARHVAQFTHRLVAERIDVVAAVEAHDGDPPLRAQPLLDLHELTVHRALSPRLFTQA